MREGHENFSVVSKGFRLGFKSEVGKRTSEVDKFASNLSRSCIADFPHNSI
jgi:hypothetical protein